MAQTEVGKCSDPKGGSQLGVETDGVCSHTKELVNRNSSGVTKNKNEHRVKSIQRLDSARISYIERK